MLMAISLNHWEFLQFLDSSSVPDHIMGLCHLTQETIQGQKINTETEMETSALVSYRYSANVRPNTVYMQLSSGVMLFFFYIPDCLLVFLAPNEHVCTSVGDKLWLRLCRFRKNLLRPLLIASFHLLHISLANKYRVYMKIHLLTSLTWHGYYNPVTQDYHSDWPMYSSYN